MAKATSQVFTGGPALGGYAFVAPAGSKRPTTAGETLDAAYKDLGYITDDGISIKTDSSSDKIKDWNLETIKVVQKTNEATITVTFAQIAPETAKALFGAGNVTTDGENVTGISYTGELLPHLQFAFATHDVNGDGILEIGDGQVTGIDAIEFKKNDVVQFKTTIELFKDGKGHFFNWLIKPAAGSPSPSES